MPCDEIDDGWLCKPLNSFDAKYNAKSNREKDERQSQTSLTLTQLRVSCVFADGGTTNEHDVVYKNSATWYFRTQHDFMRFQLSNSILCWLSENYNKQ